MLAALCVLLASCAAPTGDPTDLDRPIFGESRPTTFTLAPTSEVIHARDLAQVGRVLRRYKKLDAAERALVTSAVAARLQGLIAFEVRRLEPKYRAERQRIQRTKDKAAAARQLAALDARMRAEAVEQIAARLTRHALAVPLKTADNVSAVAFARVRGEKIEVAADAYEIDRPLARLGEGSSIEGREQNAAFIATTAVPVAPPPR